MKIRGEYRNLTSHPEKETGHTAANFEEIPAMVRDASGILKITGKCCISSHSVALCIIEILMIL